MDQLNSLPNASCILIVTMVVLAAAIVHLMARPEAQAQYAFLEQAPRHPSSKLIAKGFGDPLASSQFRTQKGSQFYPLLLSVNGIKPCIVDVQERTMISSCHIDS